MVQDEKTLLDVLRDIWRAKLYLAFFGVVGLISAFIFLKSATPYYKAEMIVAPAHSIGHTVSAMTEGTIQTQTEQLGGDEAFERFSQIYALPSMSALLLGQDGVENGIRKDRVFSFSVQSIGFDYFKRKVRIEPVSGTKFKRLYYFHPDPEFAVRLISLVHSMTDEHIRRSVLKETNERISYLNEAMSRSVNPEHRRTLAGLMMEQERVRMMVSLDQPFSASVIEPAFVSSQPKWPDPFVIYPVFLFVSLLLGYVVYGFRTHV